MSINSLTSTHPSDFFKKYTDPKDIGFKDLIHTKAKFTETDFFDSTVDDVRSNVVNQRNPVILSNAGGAGEVLSLYANVADMCASGTRPHLIVVDRKDSNIQNLWYRLLLGHTHDKKNGCLADLLNIDDKEIVGMPIEGKNLNALRDLTKKNAYDPESHFSRVIKRAPTIRDGRLREIYKSVCKNITSQLNEGKNYSVFVSDFIKSLEMNPQFHYLAHDDLFNHTRNIISGAKGKELSKYNFHCLRADIGTKEGAERIESMFSDLGLSPRGVRPVSVAYIPKIQNMSPGTISGFLRNNAELIIESMHSKTRKGSGKSWITIDSSHLPHTTDSGRLAHYDSLASARPKFKNLIKTPSYDGLPKTMVLSGLNLGYVYADRKALDSHIDIANKTGVERIIIGGGIYGPHFFQENARRQLSRPDMRLLGDQLKELKKVFNDFDGKITYVVGREDMKVADNLYEQYFNILRSKKEGKQRVSRNGVCPEREFRNSQYDGVRELIVHDLLPYLIRAGDDPTFFRDEAGAESKLELILAALSRHREGKLLKEDLGILDINALKNSDKLEVIFEGVKNYKRKDGNKVDMRVFGEVDFSPATQYQKTTQSLDEIVKMIANGTIPGSESHQIIVATGPVGQYWTAGPGDRVVMTVPEMVDDRRYFDSEFNPGTKRVISDPVHKRATVKKSLNFPGGWVQSGDIRERAYVEPTFPRILDTVEEIQKTGRGFNRKSVLVIPDLQIGSITEDLESMVKFWDYAVHTRGCTGMLGIGDLIQGRNYPDMPNENSILSGTSIYSQQMAMVRLLRPFFSQKQIDFFHAVEGNHEWNTDKLCQGHNLLAPLQAAIEQHVYNNPDHKMDVTFPVFSVAAEKGKRGQLMKSPFGFVDVNSYGTLFGHKFSEKGAGKGSVSTPATHLASWVRQMADMTRDYDILIGGHYHGLQMGVFDNRLCVVAPSFAGESGFEFIRQYGGNQPMGLIIDYLEDGRIGVESVTDSYLRGYKVKNPEVKKNGIENFIHNSINQEAVVLGRESPEMKRMYRRDIVTKK